MEELAGLVFSKTAITTIRQHFCRQLSADLYANAHDYGALRPHVIEKVRMQKEVEPNVENVCICDKRRLDKCENINRRMGSLTLRIA